MNQIWQVMKEQIINLNLIFRISIYEEKSKYRMHYLGALWQLWNSFIQIGVYWFVFGVGIRRGAPIGDTPIFLWLITGLVPWFFISSSIIQGSNSVYAKVNLVSKMKFPVSILPSIQLVANSFSFIFLLILTIMLLTFHGEFSGVYLLQLPYFILCLYIFLFGLTLLFSTLTTIIRDVQPMIQSVMRLMMYILPVLWNVDKLPHSVVKTMELNPLFYIIAGFRYTLLGGKWFFHDLRYTLYFWLITLLILFIGSSIHLKFRHKFVDYI